MPLGPPEETVKEVQARIDAGATVVNAAFRHGGPQECVEQMQALTRLFPDAFPGAPSFAPGDAH